ncbi:MAG: hypothetical protein N2111_07250 [Candidatus Sumerlaeaceae bacterium]|nr:hypothetical protein [Candidatus Sumerlaeaceae bacterium]
MRARTAAGFCLILLAVAGLGLRWWRLDLMPFRYDSAAEMWRAREVLEGGGLPVTGIINSLGFRNPAGFTWLIMPAAVCSPDPRWTAAWIGIWTMTALWPLYAAGRLVLGQRALALLPCAVWAVLPICVMGGRSIWPQNLLATVGAWGLWLILLACQADSPLRRRVAAAAAAFAVLGFGALVHLSCLAAVGVALVLLGVGMGFMRRTGDRQTKPMTGGFAVAVLLGLLPAAAGLSPSAVDGWRRMSVPESQRAAKPAHIQQYESRMPPPKPLPARLSDAIGGLFQQFSSLGATGGIDQQLTPVAVAAGRSADVALLALVLAGVARTALTAGRRRALAVGTGGLRRFHAAVLLAWVFVPPATAAFVLKRLNASYFAYTLPALLLFAGIAMRPVGGEVSRRLARATALAFAAGTFSLYIFFFFCTMTALDASRYVRGDYYIPLANQLSLVRRLAAEGVSRARFVHLSGDWFQHSYNYLFDEMGIRPAAESEPVWAVVEDLVLRGRQAHRAALIDKHATLREGPVAAVLFTGPAGAVALQRAFWAAEDSPEP